MRGRVLQMYTVQFALAIYRFSWQKNEVWCMLHHMLYFIRLDFQGWDARTPLPNHAICKMSNGKIGWTSELITSNSPMMIFFLVSFTNADWLGWSEHRALDFLHSLNKRKFWTVLLWAGNLQDCSSLLG